MESISFLEFVYSCVLRMERELDWLKDYAGISDQIL